MPVYDRGEYKDNCGFGLIAHMDGEASHRLVRTAISALDRMDHRGAIGADTAMHFRITNLQTGHRTEVHFTDMRHVPDVPDSVFEPETLAYGLPELRR